MKLANKLFMAFAKGKESSEEAIIKRYLGIAPVTILSVNPKKEELEKIYNTTIDNEPEYLGVTKEGQKQIRLDFIVKTVKEKCEGVELTSKVTFFITDEYRGNKDNTKVQVIDKYGRTAWVTLEQAKNHEIPMYSNGPANLDKDYRPCYIGEEDLTNFIQAYLNIPNVMDYVKKAWVMSKNPSESESRLDKIEDYFKGNISELQEIIKLQPTNKVKVMFGIRSTEDGRQFQTIYSQKVFKNNVTNYSKLQEEINDRKAAGALSTTEFSIKPLHEYNVEATDFSKEEPTVNPYSGSVTNPFQNSL